MLIKTTPDIPSSEITDEPWYIRRREFIRAAGGLMLATAAARPSMEPTDRAAAPEVRIARSAEGVR